MTGHSAAPARLGVDIGRVIIDGASHKRGGDTAFFDGDEEELLATPEVPDAVDSLAALVQLFDGRVWLVSRCGPRTEQRTLRWLDGHDFYRRTGIPATHVRFCRERAQKRLHCEELGLTHFVDDRPEVHAAIRGAVTHQYFFGAQFAGQQSQDVPEYGVAAPTWAVLLALIEKTMPMPGVVEA